MKLPQIKVRVVQDEYNPTSINIDCAVMPGVPLELGDFIVEEVRREIETILTDRAVYFTRVQNLQDIVDSKIELFLKNLLKEGVVYPVDFGVDGEITWEFKDPYAYSEEISPVTVGRSYITRPLPSFPNCRSITKPVIIEEEDDETLLDEGVFDEMEIDE